MGKGKRRLVAARASQVTLFRPGSDIQAFIEFVLALDFQRVMSGEVWLLVSLQRPEIFGIYNVDAYWALC